MRKNIYKTAFVVGVFTSVGVTGLSAQQRESFKQVYVKAQPVVQQHDSVIVDMNIRVDGLAMDSKRQLVLTPILSTADRNKALPSVIINGKKRNKIYNRHHVLYKSKYIQPYSVIKAGNENVNENIHYRTAVPVESWMKGASFSLEQDLCGCGGEQQQILVQMIEKQIQILKPPAFSFDYSKLVISFIEPPREAIKSLVESNKAYIVFNTGGSKINPALGNNISELAKIDHSFDYIKEESTAKITGIKVAAYASPEGSESANQRLSEQRAKELVARLRQAQAIQKIEITSWGKGEDWDTLQKLIKADTKLNDTDKDALCRIIETTPDYDKREKEIMKYKNGVPYRHLLQELYPELRRCDYAIEFSVPEFTIEKSKEMLRTKPGMLSQAELYAIANTYEKGSKDFNQLFDTAVRLFPNDPVANLNAAASEIEAGEMNRAGQRLEQFKNDPRAWNNLAVLLMRQRRMDEAETYLQKAIQQGDTDARKNLSLLQDLKKEVQRYEKAKNEYNLYNSK